MMVKIGGGVRDTPVLLHWVPVDFVSTCIVSLTRQYDKERRGEEGKKRKRGRREGRRGGLYLFRFSKSTQSIFNIVAEGPLLRDVIEILVSKMKQNDKYKGTKFEALSPAQWISKVEAKITHEFPSLYLFGRRIGR